MKHAFARELRRDQTLPERKLWQALRSRRFHGFKFWRQQPIGPMSWILSASRRSSSSNWMATSTVRRRRRS